MCIHLLLEMVYPTHPNLRHGFTILELLVVITVLSLLVLLIFSLFNRAHAASHAAICQDNLRKYYQGIQLYISENDGYLPPISMDGKLFQDFVAPYLEIEVDLKDSEVPESQIAGMLCPADTDTRRSPYRSYAVNYYLGRSLDFTARNVARLSEVLLPLSEVAYLSDGFRTANAYTAASRFSANTPGFSATNNTMGMAFRHASKAHTLWLSGRVTAMTQDSFIGRREWVYPK